jgi:predicted O-methyltransferase YrrM
MTSVLNNPHWQQQVKALHQAAADDPQRWEERRAQQASQPPQTEPDPLVRMGSIYIAVNQHEGRLLHLLARTARAQYIVEFGASYGISTLYLGAAAKDNGGKMFTTEVHPDKCQAVNRTLAQAQIDDTVTLLEGDARETLLELPAGIDLLFLDGWKSQYLPLLKNLMPKLKPGALVVADNINLEAAQDYADYIQNDPAWFTELVDDMAISVLQSF